jgi:murein DD-endopeptidase MepM/ murein hydrolase activator NlpD
MRTIRTRMLVVGIVMLSVCGVGTAQAASPADKLQEAQQRLDEVRDRLDEVSARCERNETRAARVNGKVEDTLQAVGEAEVAVDEQHGVVKATKQRLDDLEAEARRVQEVSSKRVVELYKNGVADPTLRSLLAASSKEQALGRAQVLNVVEHGDREVLEDLSASQTAVDAQRDVFEEQQRSLAHVLGERKRILRGLEEVRAEYEQKIARCNDRLVKLEQQEQIAAADEEQLAAALAERGEISVPPGVSTGGWAWPAQGPVTSGFGQRWGRLHAGIDIGAPTGAPIYAAKGGVVSYAGVMGGYGNIVVVDHGDGVTTRYAHQSRLAASVGQTVRPGDQVGYIGSTGNVTGPHLHFEVRVNDQPQDPMGYLP